MEDKWRNKGDISNDKLKQELDVLPQSMGP